MTATMLFRLLLDLYTELYLLVTVGHALRELGHVVLVLEDGDHHLLHPRAEMVCNTKRVSIGVADPVRSGCFGQIRIFFLTKL